MINRITLLILSDVFYFLFQFLDYNFVLMSLEEKKDLFSHCIIEYIKKYIFCFLTNMHLRCLFPVRLVTAILDVFLI